MKTILITLSILLLAVIANGQDLLNANTDEITVTQPEFYGTVQYVDIVNGNKVETLDSYLLRNVKFPAPDEKLIFPEGTELIRFEVNADGTLGNFKVKNSVSKAIDAEMIRVLKSTEGMWVPGKNDGVSQTMEKEVAMAFKVSAETNVALRKDFEEIAKDYFIKGSKTFFEKGKTHKALAYFNKGINYMPREGNLLFMKGMCLYEMRQTAEARDVWNDIQKISCTRYAFDLDREELAKKLEAKGIDSGLIENLDNGQVADK